MTGDALQRLTLAVQTNCHIADARAAADLTLCIYLLQMREFYRWEQGLPFGAALPRAALGQWLSEREALWNTLEEQDLRPLPELADDPFDAESANRLLAGQGLVYGAGLLGAGRPAFVLAELHARTERDGVPVTIAGRELARGLAAPPAVLGGAPGRPQILVRRESLARWCWEKFESFSLRRAAGSPFEAVVQAWDLDRDFAAALPRWLDEQTEAVLLHELGEYRAAAALGDDWGEMLLALPSRRAELHARALRDHLADLGHTLPALLERDARASVHFWFASFDGMREHLYPSLVSAYARWRAGDGGQALHRAAARGLEHFGALGRRVMALHRTQGPDAPAAIERLLTSAEAVCTG